MSQRKSIDPEQLGKLETFLQRADLSRLLRRQPVCTIAADSTPQPVFRELYISIPDLQQSVLPEYDLRGDVWLFRHLTHVLDQRMLSLLMRNDDPTIASSFSINMNVATILSQPFLTFDASLKAEARGTVIIELQNIDIVSDMDAFMSARDFVRERGYRICLDGMNPLTLRFVDRERLGLDFDLLKLVWTPDMNADATGRRQAELKEHVDRSGRDRIVLCRCDSEEAISFGQSMGLTMFQGRIIDKMVMSERRGG